MAGLAANPVEALGDGAHCGGAGRRRARLVQSRSAWKWNMVSTSLGSVRSTTSDDSRSSLKTCVQTFNVTGCNLNTPLWLILLPSRSRKPSEFAWVHASKIDQEFFCWIWVSLHVIYVGPGRRMNQASPGKSEEQPEETEEMEGGDKADDALQKASEQEADMGRGRRSRRPPSVRVVGPEWAK
uniref:Uncharacterized protein n=1 Tax=Oryza glumipatula TaxID=40148 RepID=A0A0E0BI49_9ORYZ